MQQLSLSTRPKTLDALLGQEKLVARIRGHIKTGRIPSAWLFLGPPGCGKTSTARIVALSMQCPHQKVFGKPCKECRAARKTFDIYENNCGKVRGIREIEAFLDGVDYTPRAGRYRVYILDEVHQATSEAQSLMLKYLEDSVETTMFILCSTEPHLLKETLRRRCTMYKVRPLEIDVVEKLVTKLLEVAESNLPVDRLTFAIDEAGIKYPGLIAQAVEKYVAGAEPKEAVDVLEGNEVDVSALTRAAVKGDWGDAAKYLKQAMPSDVRGIRLGLISYLRATLLEMSQISERANALGVCIDQLVALENTGDTVLTAGLAAAVYRVCQVMVEYPL